MENTWLKLLILCLLPYRGCAYLVKYLFLSINIREDRKEWLTVILEIVNYQCF